MGSVSYNITLFPCRAPRTVPQPVSAQQGLGDDPDDPVGGRSLSAPLHGLDNMDALPPSSPDSSDMGSEHSSGLTNISEARDVDVGGSPVDGDPVVVDPLELVSGSNNSKSGSDGPLMAPRPGSAGVMGCPVSHSSSREAGSEFLRASQSRMISPPGSASSRSGRPGSSKHPVLPPIGQTERTVLPEY